jgi:class 3 adenylate cyclase/predicted ATPase
MMLATTTVGAIMDIVVWLRSLGLGKYEAAFRENEIDETVLPSLTEEHLKQLGVTALGHRLKLLDAIAAMRSDASAPGPSTDLKATSNTPSPEDRAERRQVTVIFSDLVGSTALSTRMDPEDLREVISAYQKCVAEAVQRFGGFVAKYMGDGVLIYFGYPQAHEDDAERAVRAGLDLVGAVGGLKTQSPLKTRVGIATGLVVVGDLIGSGASQEKAIVGETPNLAARLQGVAAPNAVVIAESTRKLVGNLFELEDLGRQDLKGIEGRVGAWVALRAATVESRFDALHAGELTELVGREEELELLLRRWSKAKRGEGQAVLLSGEPGIGKSRLTSALMERLDNDPHTRLRYFCSPQHTDSALHPIISQMERAAGFTHDDDSQAKLDKLDALLAHSSTPPKDAALLADILSLPNDGRYPTLELDPQERRQKTLEALTAQLQALAQAMPVLMIFEDVHWIDPTALEAVGRTVDRLKTLGVLLIFTYRPEFEPPWIGRPYVTALTLNRLGEQEIIAMIDRVTGNKALPEGIRQDIMERTDGVPLFVEEMTKAVLEAESEGEAQRTTAAVPSPALAVPASLHASLMARLDRLGPAKEVAQIGAAIGREFSYPLLAAVVGRPQRELQSSLDRVVAAGLLFQQGLPPHGTYLFKHALVQDAAYGTLLRQPRRALHARIAEALEGQFADIVESQPELLARHCTEAGLIERAVPMWVQAGSNAARTSASTEALRHFNKALDLARSMPDDKARNRHELAVQINLGHVHVTAKGFGAPEAGAAYARARDLASDLQDQAQLFTSMWGLWLFNNTQPGKGAARSLSEELMALGARTGDLGQMLQACHASWTTNFIIGDFGYTSRQARRGRELYDASEHRTHKYLYAGHDPGVCSRIFGAASTFVLGFPDQALSLVREASDLAKTLNHPLSLIIGELFRTLVHLFRGEPRDAMPILDRAVRAATEAGIPRGMWANFLNGWALAVDGGAEAGVSRALLDFDAPGAAGQELLRPFYTGVLADMCRAAGRLDDGLRLVNKALELATTLDSHWGLAEAHRIKGEVLRARDEAEAAVEPCFETALAVARQQQAKSWELRASMSLARLWRDQGKVQEARELLAPVYGWFTEGFETRDLKEAKALLEQLAA